MIHKIWASDSRFKPVEFSTGLNIIVADRADKSGDKDSRNGAGKTTLLNIVHFCFGADFGKINLPKEEIKNWKFYIDIDLYGQRIIAERAISDPNIIIINSIIDKAQVYAEENIRGEFYYKNEDWKKLLGQYLFNMQREYSTKYSPSFRSAFSYFARRGADAYTEPFKHFRAQRNFDYQINNAFLLGLNWLHASEVQEIKDKENAIKAFNAAMKEWFVATQGELEAKRVQKEQELEELTDDIKSFNVHTQYKSLQEQANKLTIDIHKSSNKIVLLKKKLRGYEKSVFEEKPPSSKSVEELFLEVGVHFSEVMKTTLADAKLFHQTIVKNRKLFLESEMIQIKNELDKHKTNVENKISERAKILQLLETHGALEEFSSLQELVIEKKIELENINTNLFNIKEQNESKKEIRDSKVELGKKIQRDYEQSRPEWEKAIRLFNHNAHALYDEAGDLVIDTTENGYKLDINIQKSSSEGVSKMKIFCYDLMLIELMSKKSSIDFLFHDSSLHDGVDSRQRALALIHAHKKATEKGFQYICLLNSDMIPYDDLKDKLVVDDYVCLRLKDTTPNDALLGFHFELNKNKRT